ncbi:cyclic-phosphate processing receiver domain-containing protein [Chitinimonas lacunae]|uniref:Cyclic-phosphate processing receiver domain-containing protein n=1 Tax=Chitinimonas lacunae TaxID=1963018 RepID=A0ABV8MV05_9NEIS
MRLYLDDEHSTGYDVVPGIEEAVALHGFRPAKISVHSANSSARDKILAGIDKICRMLAKNMEGIGRFI